MTFLFSRAPLPQKILSIYRATLTHAKNLAKFVTVYKVLLLLQRYLRRGTLIASGSGGAGGNGAVGKGKGRALGDVGEGALDSFVAGMVGGWWVFGERTAVSNMNNCSLR